MKDICFPTDPIDRVEVIDHLEFGRLVAQWALDPDSRPRTLSELRREIDGIAVLPSCVESFSFRDERPEHLVINLPEPASVLQRTELLADPFQPVDYGLPRFYTDHFSIGTAPILTPLDMFYARIGDRSLSHFP